MELIRPGDTSKWEFHFQLEPLSGGVQNVDLTGAVAALIFRDKRSAGEQVLNSDDHPEVVVLTDEDGGRVEMRPVASTFGAAGIPSGKYKLRARITTAGGAVYTHPSNPAHEIDVQVTEY